MKDIANGSEKTKHLADRFWTKVQKTDCCWNWTGATVRQRYGVLSRVARNESYALKQSARKGNVYVHRISYVMHNGDIPVGMLVLHRCDNPKCVRPDHLFLGTEADNVLDMVKKHRNVTVLSESSAGWIKSRLRAGEKQCELAREFGVTRSLIHQISKGRAWAWVQEA